MAALEFTPPQQTSAAAPAMDMADYAELVRSPRTRKAPAPAVSSRPPTFFLLPYFEAPARPRRGPGLSGVHRGAHPTDLIPRPPFPQPSGLFEAARETD